MRKNYSIIVGVVLIVILLIWFGNTTFSETVLDEENLVYVEAEIDSNKFDSNGLTKREIVQMNQNDSLQDVIKDVLDEFQVNRDQVAVAYYNFQNDEHYYLNEQVAMDAASTTKVATAALMVDLINQERLFWETELPYYEHYYEEGDGDITNSEKSAAYSVEELVSEMLLYSDNTATNVLANYYMDHVVDGFAGYRQAIVELSGLENLSEEVYEQNYATAEMLKQTLIRIATDSQYSTIVEIMKQAQSGVRFKKYVSEGMAAKHGDVEEWQHDSGIYYKGDDPVYVLVVMTHGVEQVDEFLGWMNLRVHEWQEKTSGI